MALGMRGATGNGGFVGVRSRGTFEENRPDRFVFVGLTGLAGSWPLLRMISSRFPMLGVVP